MKRFVGELLNNTDDTNHSDSDGLPDSVELVIGTDPSNPDSDFDGLNDYEEALMGMNPNKADSNDDRFSDYLEVTNVSLDLDGDDLPNAWDPDNDNDGVADYIDVSPFAKTSLESAFHLDLSTSGRPTYVSFQLRTSNPDHMRLIQQSWNWPADTRGSFKDLDGSVDDVVIVPCLRIDCESQPDQDAVVDYGITVDGTSAFVPLFPVWDYGNMVALKGRMFLPYAPTPQSLSFSVSLIWRVSGLNDNEIKAFSAEGGDYLSLQANSSISASAGSVGDNETFLWVPLGGDRAALKAANGMYVTLDTEGTVSASSSEMTSGSEFKFKGLGTGSVTIIAGNGNNLTAAPDGTLSATGAEVGGTSLFAEVDLGVVSSSTVLATYYEDFTLTGLTVTENFGSGVAVCSGNDHDELMAANLLLAYRFLRNSSYGLNDTADLLADHKLTGISVDIQSFSHQDEALQVSISSMIPDAVDAIPAGATLPVIVGMEDAYASVELSDLSTDYVLGSSLSMDLLSEPVVVSKMLRSSWYVGGDDTPLELYEVIDELRSWNLGDESLQTAVGLVSAWYCGEHTVASIGGVDIDYDCPEVVFVDDVVEDIIDIGMGVIDALLQAVEILDSAYAFAETFSRLGTITKSAGQSTWNAFKTTFNSVKQSLISETKVFQRITTAMNIVAVVLAVGISLYALFSIGEELGWGAVGTGIAVTYAVVTLAYSLALLALAVYGGPVGAIIADIIMIIDILAQILFGFDFLGEFIGWLIDCFTDVRTRSEVSMDYIDSDMSFVDVDSNGVDAGDNISYGSRLYGNVSITGDGSYSDLVDSYIIPRQVLWAPWGSRSVSGSSTVANSTTYTGTSKSVLYETEAWLRPGIGMVNFPVAVGLYTDYRVYYDDCWWFFGWWCDRESQTNDPANTQVSHWTTIYFDVMPGTVSEFYNWRGMVSSDSDGDGVNNSEEADAGTDPWSLDTDGDGLGDDYELEIGSDPLRIDVDGDGLNDLFEHSRGYDPRNPDSDGDGLKDFFEYRGWAVEITYRGQEYYWMVNSDPCVADTDGDGVNDFDEYYSLLNPRSGDTDGDGTPDEALNYYITRIEYDSTLVPSVEDYNPFVVAVDEDGFVYTNNHYHGGEVVVFAPNGTQIGWFTTLYSVGDLECMSVDLYGERQTVLVVSGGGHLLFYATNGTLINIVYDTELGIVDKSIRGIAFDPDGPEPGTSYLYVPVGSHLVLKLLMNGTDFVKIAAQWGELGTGPGQFDFNSNDADIDIDAQHRLYISDCGNSRIQKFEPDGTFLTEWGEDGYQDGFLHRVRSVAIDADGNLLTFDKGGDFADRIQKWTSEGRWLYTFEGYAYGDCIDVDRDNFIYVAGWDNASKWNNVYELVHPVPDYTFLDADDDGLTDVQEVAGWNITVALEFGTSTLSVISDPMAPDTDFDGLLDADEAAIPSNPLSIDSDDDGLSDLEELGLGTNLTHWDSDGDGLGDGIEAEFGSDPLVQDSDGEGLSDYQEFMIGTNPNSDDTDEDTLDDLMELGYGSDPKNPDSDGDLMFDGQEFEVGADPGMSDTDNDGIDDGYEMLYETNATSGDSDGDLISDGFEVSSLMSPLSNDTDGDGVNDTRELALGLNPKSRDSDGDGVPDSLDQDFLLTLDGEIVLAYDDPDACAVFASQLSGNATVRVVDASKIQSDYSGARYIVLVGDPNASPDTAGSLICQLLQDSGDVLERMISSEYERMAVRYGLWTETQTIVMLSHVYDTDWIRVLGVLKSMRMTITGSSVLVDYLNPRACFRLDQIDTMRTTDAFVWTSLSNMTTFSVNVERLNGTEVQDGLANSDALAPEEVIMDKYIRIQLQLHDQNASVVVLGSLVRIYYASSDLDMNGDGDADDPEDLNESWLELFVMSAAGEWKRLSDGVYTTGVNTTNLELFGRSYEGYLWANISSLSLFGIAGFTNEGLPTPDEMYDELRDIICHYRDVGILSKGRANGLLQKVDASQNRWQDKAETMAATNILEALVNEAEALVKSGTLTQDEGSLLIEKANMIIAAIQPL
ncbi:MAG: hypothetical protein JW880_06725 [Candidatus Thermoplasmatota archaeon]|nr:hypothetical protein [Candidatus Thermoplasmatota archaeon]